MARPMEEAMKKVERRGLMRGPLGSGPLFRQTLRVLSRQPEFFVGFADGEFLALPHCPFLDDALFQQKSHPILQLRLADS